MSESGSEGYTTAQTLDEVAAGAPAKRNTIEQQDIREPQMHQQQAATGGKDAEGVAVNVTESRDAKDAAKNFPYPSLLTYLDRLARDQQPGPFKRTLLRRKPDPQKLEQVKGIREAVLGGDFSGVVSIKEDIEKGIKANVVRARVEQRIGDDRSSLIVGSLGEARQLASALDKGLQQKGVDKDEGATNYTMQVDNIVRQFGYTSVPQPTPQRT